jgi:hypothetical protein
VKLNSISIRTHPLLQHLRPMADGDTDTPTKYGNHDAEHVPHVGVVLKSSRYFYS